MPILCIIFLLIVISVEPFYSPRKCSTNQIAVANALANQIAGERSGNFLHNHSEIAFAARTHRPISEWFNKIFFVYSIATTLPHLELHTKSKMR